VYCVTYPRYHNYDERLAVFNLERLELRKIHFDLVEVFKILRGYTVCNVKKMFDLLCNDSHTSVNTRGYKFKLYHRRCKRNVFKCYFSNHNISIWNSLPSSCFNFSLICNLKSKILHVNFNHFMSGQL
jgi:hypothetical protein